MARVNHRPSSASQIIAGAWCIVEAGCIVRATRLKAELGAPSRFWAAGRGSWSRQFDPQSQRLWPTHYAGPGPLLEVL